jgi:hypothetical protein
MKMLKKSTARNQPNLLSDNDAGASLPGYPMYPDSEDIYSQSVEVSDIDPENIAQMKEPNENEEEDEELISEEEIDEDFSGDDLDVPGSELDDEQEDIGNEDEENNYYSIGGDNHNDLEEDQGDLDE